MSPIPASRLRDVPRYIFSTLEEKIEAARVDGREICDLSQSDPNWPASASVVEALRKAALDQNAHRYPPYEGANSLREAFADWYGRNYSAPCTRENVLIVEGSKLAIALMPLAYVDPGECALIPDPGYPTYAAGVALAGGEAIPLTLRPELHYLPDYGDLDGERVSNTRLMFLNYPHNPTGAVATVPFLEETVRFCREHDLPLAYDLAYAKIVLRGQGPALSVRAVRGAQSVAIELFTFSKSYDMQGFRLGAAVGDPDLLAPLARVHENVAAGAYLPIQAAGRTALDPHEDQALAERVAGYVRRQEVLSKAIAELGGHATRPDATVYLWMHAPRGMSGETFATELLERAGIAVTPGIAFGQQGERYVRISLTSEDAEVDEAAHRLRAIYAGGFDQAPARSLHGR
ncbi:MAG: aminotransferase class I/II-fold pyridoxal phosphate-dependent enzyme [Thermaerobacter sp.]|nr:aminotransferase class I/II-fold pyridoxal phosphate-dependent enzyme [Thermaerobacter sp.]